MTDGNDSQNDKKAQPVRQRVSKELKLPAVQQLARLHLAAARALLAAAGDRRE